MINRRRSPGRDATSSRRLEKPPSIGGAMALAGSLTMPYGIGHSVNDVAAGSMTALRAALS
jgi:hypothetical protein